MPVSMNKLPKKLRDDAIIEALCEIRFEANELPEIVVGRLSDNWRSFHKERLAVADIPMPIRIADENLRHAPVLELKEDDSSWSIRVGSNVISLHIIGSYCGWDEFRLGLEKLVKGLFLSLPQIVIYRIGLRYINAFSSSRHFMSSLSSLNLSVQVADSKVEGPLNLNFLIVEDESHTTITRLASPEFVQGKLPGDTVAALDIDVFTPDGFKSADQDAVMSWIERARKYERAAFFKLIPAGILNQLVEEWEQ